jgi:16S rRNA (guanine966-N2)-methyltransferase
MRIIAGEWRGRLLTAPPGQLTRPTGQRMRQAIFDMVMHAPWGGRGLVEGASVLDGFAGTGAMGLEALSRGAGKATFLEQAPSALACVYANVASCKAGDRARVIATDVRHPPRGEPQAVVFLDPPYDQGLLAPSLAALRASGWITPGTIVVAESARFDLPHTNGVMLAHRVHGAAQVNVWREE